MENRFIEYINEFHTPWIESLPDGTSKFKLLRFLEFLAKGINEELKFGLRQFRKPNGRFGAHYIKSLGVGSFGTAFDLKSERVLKITGDSSEALYAHKIIKYGNKFKNLVKYYKVVNLEGAKSDDGLYVLVMEKVNKLEYTQYQRLALLSYDHHSDSEFTLTQFIERGMGYYQDHYNFKNIYNEVNVMWEDIKNIYKECDDIDLNEPDIHMGNIGQIDGRIIFYDISDNLDLIDYDIPKLNVSQILHQLGGNKDYDPREDGTV